MIIEDKNIGWIDALRVAACFVVVFAHSCDPFVAQFDANREMFLTGVFMGSLTRPCVPIFVMMTAVLLLPVGQGTTIGAFYSKRIGRLVKPLIFWSLALPLLTYAYFVYVNPHTANMQLSVADYTSETLLGRLYTFIFNFNFDTTPLWYLYMLIGLYLIMPIISSWLAQASRKDIKTVLGVWVGTLFIPYLNMLAPLLGYKGNYGNMGLFGVCDWNIYGSFYYLSGFIGYIILAYYLKTYPPEWSRKKMVAISLPMFLAGYAITSLGYIKTNEYFPGNYAYLEILWYFCSVNVFMMTLPVFLLFQRLATKSRPWLTGMAKLTFGIYLCHFVFTFVGYDIFDTPTLPYALRIVLAATLTFSISTTLVWAMSKSKITRIFIS
ncbi:MAG: acyltransferase family protein [Bacteroidaceae bacterium]|nr:acyltransferase family protein [Bacteroidaceae bacterium]